MLYFKNALINKGGLLESVAIQIADIESSGFTLFIFSSNPSATTWTDAAVAAIAAGDVAKVVAAIPLAASSALGTHPVLYAEGLGIHLSAGSTDLWGVLLSNAALTNDFAAATDVSVTIGVVQER